jgi:hypothetical protein
MSAIYNFKICAQMNKSLIPPFKGAEIVKTNCKGKVKKITKAGGCQVVVQLRTNSWRHVHRMYSVVQLGPNPFFQTLR